MHRLYDKFLSNTLSPKEEERLLMLLKETKHKQELKVYMLEQRDLYAALLEIDLNVAYSNIQNHIKKPKTAVSEFYKSVVKYTAIYIIFLSIPSVMNLVNDSNNIAVVALEKNWITLELENSKAITLNETRINKNYRFKRKKR